MRYRVKGQLIRTDEFYVEIVVEAPDEIEAVLDAFGRAENDLQRQHPMQRHPRPTETKLEWADGYPEVEAVLGRGEEGAATEGLGGKAIQAPGVHLTARALDAILDGQGRGLSLVAKMGEATNFEIDANMLGANTEATLPAVEGDFNFLCGQTESDENDCVHCCGTGDKPYSHGAASCAYCNGSGLKYGNSLRKAANPEDAKGE